MTNYFPDPATILAVDDTSESLVLLVKILTQAGYQVRPADSGELALAAVAAALPDLILLDVHLQGIDGLEVCRRLKAGLETRHIPIILISATADLKDAVEGLQRGAADYITKPFRTEELLARIKTHLSLSRVNISLEQQSAALHQVNAQLQSEIVNRQFVETELRQSLDQAERSRRAMLNVMEDQKRTEKALAESEIRYRTLVEQAPVAIYVNRGGRLVLVNAACLRLFGATTSDQLLGKSPYELFHPDFHSVLNERIHHLLNHGSAVPLIEEKIIRLDGTTVDVEVTAAPFEDRGFRSIHVVLRDITERKQAEAEVSLLHQELQGYIAELEQRVAHRTAQLESANKELEAFSYSVSHDLRAPLRSIDGFSQALLEEYQEKLDDTGKGYLERVRKATQRMGRLIDDLLKLSRINQTEIRHKSFDLSGLARAIAEELQKNNPDRAIEVIIQEGVVVQGDPSLLQIVLQNLLDNAFKFTGREAQARIEVGTAVMDGKTVYYIRDNGAGFDMAYAGKLFGAFQRLHTKEEFPGTGIGLATVQRIINRHGGRVWAEGEVEKGAVFYFTLP